MVGGSRGRHPTNFGEQSHSGIFNPAVDHLLLDSKLRVNLLESHSHDGASANQVSPQSPNQSSHVYFQPQSQGYHPSQGQPYGSPQFSSGHQFPKQHDVSEQLVDTSGLLSSRPTRHYRSPSLASNNSNYTRGSLNTELHNSELPNEPFPLVFGSSNRRKVYFMPCNEQDFFRAGRVSHSPLV